MNKNRNLLLLGGGGHDMLIARHVTPLARVAHTGGDVAPRHGREHAAYLADAIGALATLACLVVIGGADPLARLTQDDARLFNVSISQRALYHRQCWCQAPRSGPWFD